MDSEEGKANKITCILSILDDKSKEPVVFKHDGGRFELPTTLKLLIGEMYHFKINLRYASFIEVEDVLIDDQRVVLNSTNDHKNREIEINFAWDTTRLKPTSRKKRDRLFLQLQLSDAWHIAMNFQVKIYEKATSHLFWGQQLTTITIDACREEESTGVVGIQYYTITNVDYGTVH